MKQTILALALMGTGLGLASAVEANLTTALGAYQAGRCDEAVATLMPMAKAGNAVAQQALGDLYLNDEGLCETDSRDTSKALPWYLLAAGSGNVAAQRRLIALYDGIGKMDDPVQVTFWLAKVAALGGASDLSRLATRHERAEGVPHDRVLAHTFNLLASRSVDQGERKSKDDELDKILIRNAAEMSPEQLTEAETLAAAWKVGTALPAVSTTGKRDPREWYKAAAEAGDLAAAYKAGTLYWKFGYGLTAQPEQAAFWLHKAAEGGIADAQYQLGQLYAMGYGVPKDYVLAYVLNRLAVKGGSEAALAHKNGWDDALTAQQLSEGKALLARWKKGDALPQASKYGMQRKVNYVEDATGKATPTADVLALFKAANEGMEAQFIQLLAKVKDINDYLVDDEKLLHALLLPAQSLRAEADEWRKARKNGRDVAHWKAQQARHAALLPAKTRMLALALRRGARFDEGSQPDNAAPLHLAAMFGTPEMVKLLLEHGADPCQYGGRNKGTAPLEFALDQKEYGRGLPELITPEQRTGNLLALLHAGAARPYIHIDLAERRKKDEGKKDGKAELKRPVADYLLWPNVLAQTRGTAVLDALLKTGTRPAVDDEGRTVFDYAAEAGNVEAIAWLKKRVPRYGQKQRDRWLDAAMLAMHSSAPGREQVLQQLLVKGMPWSQKGPQDDGYSHNYHTLYGGEQIVSDTLLAHATAARRFDWIPKLAALGAPVTTGGSAESLARAVERNDIDGVKVMLAQGADPLGGMDSALSLALETPDDKDVLLDLLLDHVVRVQKKSLAEMRTSPLEAVLKDPATISMTRLRKLLKAGASVDDLSRTSIETAFAAPDRNVARLLIEHGLLRRAGGGGAGRRDGPGDTNVSPPGEPYFLISAIRTGRTDLLPAILARPEDPNRRAQMRDNTWGPSPVESAITQGNTEVLKVLLAHGGVIDATSSQHWGTALDRAVGSLNADMLRLVSKDFSLPLNQVCLKATGQLAIVVLDASASYWDLLRQHGFAAGSACTGIQARLVRYLAETPDVLLEGWVGQRLAERIVQLGPVREDFDDALWEMVAASQNDALTRLLACAGWKAAESSAAAPAEAVPQRDKAADVALQAALPGHYYLSGVTEVGAEILLRPNGKFEYSMSYGAVDEYAKGEWTVWNQQVIFRSQQSQGKAASMRPSIDAPSVTLPQGQLLVDLRYRGKSMAGFKVVALGEAPVKMEGETGAQGWRTPFSGPVRHIAVSHPEIEGRKWMVYAVPMTDALRGSFQLDFDPPTATTEGFNATLVVGEGSLILQREGRDMRFERQ